MKKVRLSKNLSKGNYNVVFPSGGAIVQNNRTARFASLVVLLVSATAQQWATASKRSQLKNNPLNACR